MEFENNTAVKAGTKAEYEREDKGFIGHPRPLSSLFFTEFWERFSYYGIRAILVIFMTAAIYDKGLGLDTKTAGAIMGVFGGAVFLLALPGGWLADNWLGQRTAVWYGSVIMALGHLSIALMTVAGTKMFYLGLVLIAIGSGLFKTCISVMVGSLYKEGDNRRDAGFSIFYMGINLGALGSPLLTGYLADQQDWHLGFGLGGLGMLIALFIFRFAVVPAMERYGKISDTKLYWGRPENVNPYIGPAVLSILAVAVVYMYLVNVGYFVFNPVLVAGWLGSFIGVALVAYFLALLLLGKLTTVERLRLSLCFLLLVAAACFWAAFEQQPTSYNLFAEHYTNRKYFDFVIPVAWVQSINSLFVIIFAPVFAYLWLVLGRVNCRPNFTTKFVAGLLCGAVGFAIMMYAAKQVIASGGAHVSLLWIVASLFLLTCGELFLSPVGLSAMSELAPASIKGQVMGLWLAASALGNVIAGLIGGHVHSESINDLPNLFGSVAASLVICAVLLLLLALPLNRILSKQTSNEI